MTVPNPTTIARNVRPKSVRKPAARRERRDWVRVRVDALAPGDIIRTKAGGPLFRVTATRVQDGKFAVLAEPTLGGKAITLGICRPNGVARYVWVYGFCCA